MAGNGLLKRRLGLFDTVFINRQCKSPEGHQRLMKSSIALVLGLLLVKNFVLIPYQAQQIASKKLNLTVSLSNMYAFYKIHIYTPYFLLYGPRR